MDVGSRIETFREDWRRLKAEIAKAVVGQEEVVDEIFICLAAGGHALLEGVPGLGKTLMVRTLARCLSLKFSRIQFTPDLMPADILGTNVLIESRDGRKEFEFQPGPIFGNVILADEINRATPKTQSALLEAMQECAVTLAGTRRELEPPFLVLATQNPIEMEGTYPLPEAQLDRFFFKIVIQSPDEQTLVAIVDATTQPPVEEPQPVLDASRILALRDLAREVPIAPQLVQYAVRLVGATQPDSDRAADSTRKFVRYGAGVRGAQALVLAAKVRALMEGRGNVAFEDLKSAAIPALRHRLILNFEGEAEGVSPESVIAQALDETPELPEAVAGVG